MYTPAVRRDTSVRRGPGRQRAARVATDRPTPGRCPEGLDCGHGIFSTSGWPPGVAFACEEIAQHAPVGSIHAACGNARAQQSADD